jgi:hypothetical protein
MPRQTSHAAYMVRLLRLGPSRISHRPRNIAAAWSRQGDGMGTRYAGWACLDEFPTEKEAFAVACAALMKEQRP